LLGAGLLAMYILLWTLKLLVRLAMWLICLPFSGPKNAAMANEKTATAAKGSKAAKKKDLIAKKKD
jgi:hypothetical protein